MFSHILGGYQMPVSLRFEWIELERFFFYGVTGLEKTVSTPQMIAYQQN